MSKKDENILWHYFNSSTAPPTERAKLEIAADYDLKKQLQDYKNELNELRKQILLRDLKETHQHTREKSATAPLVGEPTALATLAAAPASALSDTYAFSAPNVKDVSITSDYLDKLTHARGGMSAEKINDHHQAKAKAASSSTRNKKKKKSTSRQSAVSLSKRHNNNDNKKLAIIDNDDDDKDKKDKSQKEELVKMLSRLLKRDLKKLLLKLNKKETRHSHHKKEEEDDDIKKEEE